MIGTIINFTIVDNYHSVTSYEIPMFASKIALLEVTNLPQNGSSALRAGGGPPSPSPLPESPDSPTTVKSILARTLIKIRYCKRVRDYYESVPLSIGTSTRNVNVSEYNMFV